jgi:hypothetical protein
MFLNVADKWSVSTHDSHILSNCMLSETFETGRIQNGCLLGGRGYGLNPWLLTPVPSPEACVKRTTTLSTMEPTISLEKTDGTQSRETKK